MKNYQARILYPKKLPFKSEREINNFSDKQKLREPIASRLSCRIRFKEKKKKSSRRRMIGKKPRSNRKEQWKKE